MSAPIRLTALTLLAALAAAGCTGGNKTMPGKGKAATTEEIKTAREKLDQTDRALVEEQEWCVVSTKQRLGSMGAPVKLSVKDKVVFICCDHCKEKALGDPDKTLAALEANKKRATEERAVKGK